MRLVALAPMAAYKERDCDSVCSIACHISRLAQFQQGTWLPHCYTKYNDGNELVVPSPSLFLISYNSVTLQDHYGWGILIPSLKIEYDLG